MLSINFGPKNTSKKITLMAVKKHFDSLSGVYDSIKKKNPYYQQAITNRILAIIPTNCRILDFGCGTGSLVRSIRCKNSVGYDFSPKMIAVAKNKKPKLKSVTFTSDAKMIKGKFDNILMIDVIEHLSSPQKTINSLSTYCSDKTKVILTHVNTFWEPILSILEKKMLKMPEGPHVRYTDNEVINMFKNSGFKLLNKDKIALFDLFIIPKPVSLLIFQKETSDKVLSEKHK